MADPEITRLLLQELDRHGATLAGDATLEVHRRAVHALKGSAALADQPALAAALSRVERRIARDPRAIEIARAIVDDARAALSSGRSIPAPSWPTPPDDLENRLMDPTTAAIYAAEMQDRLERIDRALTGGGDDRQAAAAAFREVHAIKGGALAVGDEITAWFCHGLEEQLRAGERSEPEARRALDLLDRWRSLLAELFVAPDRGLETLRALSESARRGSAPSYPTLRATALAPLAPLAPERLVAEGPPSVARASSIGGSTGGSEAPGSDAEPPRSALDDAMLRVATTTLDRLIERIRQLGQARVGVTERAAEAQYMAVRTRHLRGNLADALRLIGPARPWGAPAAAIARVEEAAHEIAILAEELERASSGLREIGEQVRSETAAAHGELVATRTTKIGWLFDRIAAAVAAQARREGREVRVQIAGNETPIDRRVAEMLFDPVLQLARNAVSHGVEPPADRVVRGKPPAGTIHLTAEPRGGGLRIRVQDDGVGVDVVDLRRRAVAQGTISAEMAHAADDQTLLALLFVPGFTTREGADLLAGRGVGLDLTLEAVRRLGGTIRLVSRLGVGMTATLDVPFERGLVTVLWIEAAGTTFGIPVQHARRVVLRRAGDGVHAVPLAACLHLHSALALRDSVPPSTLEPEVLGSLIAAQPPALERGFAIELDPYRKGERPPMIAVDHVGGIEEVALRAVSPLVSTAGPYAGAIVRGDGIRLCLDAHVLAEVAAFEGNLG